MEKEIPQEGGKKEADLTAARNKRCEKAVAKILQILLDEDLLFNDVSFVEQKINEYLQALFSNILVEHKQIIFETLANSLRKSLGDATTLLWEKERDQLTLKDLDQVLKSKKK